MLKTSQLKKLALIVIFSLAVIFIAGAFFIYKTGRISNKNFQNSLPASINNLSSGIEAADKQVEAPEQTSNPSVGLPEGSAVAQSNGNGSGNNKNSGAVNQEESAPANQISVALFVGDKKYEISVPENSSVYELMEKLQQETDFRFSGKNYPEMGFFVEEINGIKNNPKNSQYWIYYVNNKSANQGISGLKIKQGDIIMWKYEK